MKSASLIASCVLLGLLLAPARSAVPNCSSWVYDIMSRNEICTQCNIGYYLSAGRCYSCPSSCFTCTAPNYCLSCKSTYYLTVAYTCASCGTGCASCRDANSCSQCSSSFFMNGNYCSPCLSSCVKCLNSRTCIECSFSYQKVSNAATGMDECKATASTVLMWILVIAGLIICIPCICCCICWGSIAASMGWGSSSTVVVNDSYDNMQQPQYGYGQPQNQGYNSGMPYNNNNTGNGMPYNNSNSGMPY